MKGTAPSLSAAALLLAACGGDQDRAENVADQLEDAAAQSDEAAEEVLQNAADRLREGDLAAPPGTVAQDALQRAGNEQADTLPRPTPEERRIPSPAGDDPAATDEDAPPSQTRSAPPER